MEGILALSRQLLSIEVYTPSKLIKNQDICLTVLMNLFFLKSYLHYSLINSDEHFDRI